jgi:hypothetical protein
MKEFLKELYIKSKRDFEVWNYLWLFSENNKINFSQTELSARFRLPPSSLHRILNIYPEQWNDKKVFVEYSRVAYKKYNVTFYPNGKKYPKQEVYTIYDELFEWLKGYYAELDFDYADIKDHKRYVKVICDKLKKAMLKNGTKVDEALLKNTFKVVFTNIDDWWKDTGNITLTLVSKHFTKILNQLKANNGNSKKRDSYDKAAAKVDEVDFSKLAAKS